jgi:hypothetical protein
MRRYAKGFASIPPIIMLAKKYEKTSDLDFQVNSGLKSVVDARMPTSGLQ